MGGRGERLRRLPSRLGWPAASRRAGAAVPPHAEPHARAAPSAPRTRTRARSFRAMALFRARTGPASRAGRGSARLGPGAGGGGRGACGSGGGGGGVAQRQARTVAATGATDKRVESQPQALRQRDRPSPKDRLEGGRRRESQRLSTSRARTPPLPSILRDGGRSAAPRRGNHAGAPHSRRRLQENVDVRGQDSELMTRTVS